MFVSVVPKRVANKYKKLFLGANGLLRIMTQTVGNFESAVELI
jgi:hypothetical protein